jgi:hypothetical protein
MKFSISLMGKSNVGDVNYFPTVLKMNFDTGIARSLGHRAKPLRFLQCSPFDKAIQNN